MKKAIRLAGVLFAAVSFWTGTCLAADGINLYENLSRRSEVKVFVSAPVDSTGKEIAHTDDLKAELEKSLTARKSIRFKVVPTREEADLAIDTIILELIWSENDPVDMLMGLGMTAVDALSNENYVRMQAHFVVTDISRREIVWQDKLLSTVTKSPMSEKEAAYLINPDMAKTFIRQAFSKRR